jgi:hypothetical protein
MRREHSISSFCSRLHPLDSENDFYKILIIMNTLLTLITLLTLWPPVIGAQPEDWSLGQYKVESTYDSAGGRRYSILKDGQQLFTERPGQFWFVTVAKGKQTGTSQEPKTADINADGAPDLIVEQFPTGRQCCWSYNIFSLGSTFKELAKAEGFSSPVTFEDVNGDAIYEIVTEDSTFFSWLASPRVVLRYDKGRYVLATNLMRRTAPTPVQLAAKAKEFKGATVYGDIPVAPEVYRYMLDLIYSGNAASAWAFLDLAWSQDSPGKTEFINRLKNQLKTSPYWPELSAMNRLGS